MLPFQPQIVRLEDCNRRVYGTLLSTVGPFLFLAIDKRRLGHRLFAPTLQLGPARHPSLGALVFLTRPSSKRTGGREDLLVS